jgi:hypothetical protein
MRLKTLSLVGILGIGLSLSVRAQLHFPSALTNELDHTVLGQDTKKVVVVIHGWQPCGGNGDAYASGAFYNLSDELEWTLLTSDWKLVLYHWEKDADTAAFCPLATLDFPSASLAADNASSHGTVIGQLLVQQAPNLRQVHIIAHSAGIWAAYEAAEYLLAMNPYVVVQVTFLDGFVPGDVDQGNPLNVTFINNLATAVGNNRIFRLENYHGTFACGDPADLVAGACNNTFSWRSGIDINLVTSFNSLDAPFVCYHSHDGPIQFYADTVAADETGATPSTCLVEASYGLCSSFQYGSYGWYRSLFELSPLLPKITASPQGQSVVNGANVSLSVSAQSSQSLSYQWFYNGHAVSGATSSSYSFTASSTSAGEYVVEVSNQNGLVFSDGATVTVVPPGTPNISSISPSSLPPSSSPQLVTISGSNFLSSGPNASTTIFYDPSGNPHAATPINITSTSMQCYITVGSVTGTWSVKVVNGSVQSAPFTFAVAAVNAQLTGLYIAGPVSVTKNTYAQYTATAVFSDGTSSTVTPSSWTLNSGAPASISSSGLLSAGNVSVNTPVTATATYTLNGITKTANYSINIVTGTTSYQFKELITNGTFLNGSYGWTLTGNFQADSRFSVYNNEPGYAYLANSDGSGGNNLSGTLSQTITIPANATSATLGFYYRITTTESGSIGYDFLNIQLITGSGTVHLGYKSNADSNSSYTYQSFDLGAYKGQTVTVQFYATTDGSNPTVFRVDDVSVQVLVPVPPTPVWFGVGGPASVLEGGTAQYNAIVAYSDGSIVPVTPNWSVSGPAAISSSGFLTAGSVNIDTPATITATYSGFNPLPYNITIINVAPVFSYLTISGPTTINENSSGQFSATAVYSDGSSVSVPATWSVTSGPGSISSSGLLTVGQVNGNTTTTISANYTIGSITRSATQQVSVVYVAPPPTLTSLSINGPSSVNENSTAQYSGTAWFSDGSSQIVNPTWTVNSTIASISEFGLLSAGIVPANTHISVSASYTVGGNTSGASQDLSINVVSATVTPSAGSNGTISPSAPQTVNLGASTGFSATSSSGYTVDQWLINGLPVQTGGATFTLNNVLLPTSVEVTFKLAIQGVNGVTFSNAMFSCSYYGQVGSNYEFQASTDMVHWTAICEFTCTNSPMTLTDPMAGNYKCRFYRVGPAGAPQALSLGIGLPKAWTTNGLQLALCGPLGSNYLIQASTDLVNWQTLTNFTTLTISPLYFCDSAATNYNHRFYRARIQ